MLTALLLVAMVLPAMMLGHMAHEEFQSQKAYRRAQPVRHASQRAGLSFQVRAYRRVSL
jgi:hypothetical protein